MKVSEEPTSKQRSALMRGVRVKRTSLEMKVSALLKAQGCKIRRNCSELPGSPDIIIRAQKKAIFVHGCFWHGHTKCSKGRTRPKTRREFWEEKIARNVRRDRRVLRELQKLGWKVLIIWECQLRDRIAVNSVLTAFLNSRSS
jgi:DNA mismatch endonuclease, patch repair protein